MDHRAIMRTVVVLATALLASGCTTALPPVEVTRFYTAEVARTGLVRIEPREADDASSLEYRTFANAVAQSLSRTGFTVADGTSATSAPQFRAIVSVSRGIIRSDAPRRSPVSVGVGGSTGSYGGGLGIGIGFNLSGPPKPEIVTSLFVQLRRIGDDATIWEGRAETRAREGSPASQPGIAAGKLADALLRDYPGRSGETIMVR
jgi:hypothetical protein